MDDNMLKYFIFNAIIGLVLERYIARKSSAIRYTAVGIMIKIQYLVLLFAILSIVNNKFSLL